jgi:pilus assembly protein Flp/PilA
MLRSQKGQGLAEYALILALIALIVIAAVVILGTNISTIMQSVAEGI